MILHIDMDAFYAAVEQLDHPQLRGKCVIVGGTSNRGVVATASYEARRFGVRSAMPIFQARQLCPHAVFVPPRMDRYQEVSRQVMAILREFSPLVEPVSIDEAFLDLAGTERLHGAPVEMARAIKREILARCAPHQLGRGGAEPVPRQNRLRCQQAGRPDRGCRGPGRGVHRPAAHREGLGRGAQDPEPSSRRMGVRYLGAIRKFEPQALLSAFGTYGMRLRELAYGIDPTPVTPFVPGKSVSSECTLDEDTREIGRPHPLPARPGRGGGRRAAQRGVKARTGRTQAQARRLQAAHAPHHLCARDPILPGDLPPRRQASRRLPHRSERYA
ncbi:MAG: DNA polymerase IV [Desulfobacterales bacterium]|nr:DNA polymerase IV [Desulfobacterales bacterium]